MERRWTGILMVRGQAMVLNAPVGMSVPCLGENADPFGSTSLKAPSEGWIAHRYFVGSHIRNGLLSCISMVVLASSEGLYRTSTVSPAFGRSFLLNALGSSFRSISSLGMVSIALFGSSLAVFSLIDRRPPVPTGAVHGRSGGRFRGRDKRPAWDREEFYELGVLV